jgi:uncharacterized protein (TIGR04255 family)
MEREVLAPPMPTGRQRKQSESAKSALAAEPGTLFPNPPLKEASFEIRFNPLLKIQRDLSNFQEQIAAEYPVLGKDSSVVGSEQVETFVFKSEDEKRIVRASIKSFGFSTLAYHGYIPFKKELLEKTELFCNCFDINTFKRVGLRYINNIEIEERDNYFNLVEFVQPLIDLGRVPVKELRRYAQEIALRKDIGQVTIRSGLMPLPPQVSRELAKAVVVLDLDVDTEEPTNRTQLSSLLDGFHAEVETAFLTQITKSMVNRMRQEPSA